jgi:hypothetical protein
LAKMAVFPGVGPLAAGAEPGVPVPDKDLSWWQRDHPGQTFADFWLNMSDEDFAAAGLPPVSDPVANPESIIDWDSVLAPLIKGGAEEAAVSPQAPAPIETGGEALRSPFESSSSSEDELESRVDDIHPLHEHPLDFLFGDDSWRCDGRDAQGGCRALGKPRRFHKDVGSYSCDGCEFDICKACFDDRQDRAKDDTSGPLSESSCSSSEDEDNFWAGVAEAEAEEGALRMRVREARVAAPQPAKPQAPKAPPAPSIRPPTPESSEEWDERGDAAVFKEDRDANFASGAYSVSKYSNGSGERFVRPYFESEPKTASARRLTREQEVENAIAYATIRSIDKERETIAEASWLCSHKERRRLLDAEEAAGTFVPCPPGTRGTLFLPGDRVFDLRRASIVSLDDTARLYKVSVEATDKFEVPAFPAAVRHIGTHCFNKESPFEEDDYVASSSDEETGAEEQAGVARACPVWAPPSSPAPASTPRPPRDPQSLDSGSSPGSVMLFPSSPTSGGATTSTTSSTSANTPGETPQDNSATPLPRHIPFYSQHGPVQSCSSGVSSSDAAALGPPPPHKPPMGDLGLDNHTLGAMMGTSLLADL